MSGQPIEDRLRDLFRHQATFLDDEDTQPAEWSNDPGPEQAHRTSRRPLAVAAGLALIGAAGLGILWVRDEGPAATVTTADDEASPDIGEPDIEDPNLWWPNWSTERDEFITECLNDWGLEATVEATGTGLSVMRPIGPSDPGFDARVDTCSWEHSAFRAQSVPEETDLNGPALEAYLDTFEACLRSRDVEFERSGAVFTYPDPAVTDTEGFRRSTFRCTSEATAAEYRLRTSQQPSQSAQDAQRDNVVPGLAALPIHERVAILSWVNTSEGTWALSRPPQTNGGQFLAGPVVGDPAGTRGVDMISLVEYGELLLLDDNGQIVKAYPMPGAPPTWILAAPPFLYAGRTGDGALPDSTLVRIDRSTLEAAFVVVPAALDGATQWPPEWFLAPADIANGYGDLVEIRPRPTAESGGEASPGEMIGESLIGLVVVDRDGVDAFINETIQRGTLISDTPPALVDAVYPTMTTIEARRLLDSDDPLPDRGDLAIEYATEILGLEDPFAWLERTESDRRIWQIDSNTLSVLVAIEARGHRSNGETLYVITSASTFADGEWDLSLAVNPVEGIWTVESSFPEFGVEATVTYAANGWETSGATGTGEIKLTLPEEPLTTARFTVAYTDTAGNIVGYHSTLWPAGD